MNNKELLKLAEEARKNAYAPYSNFHVGAALLTKSGKVFTGCNVECASYGGTNCAERTAIFKAISEGEREFEKIAISSDNKGETYPCGICRQVILEFGRNIKVVVGESDGEYKEISIEELIPCGFTGADINK
ncbi:cytidine deaminase [Tepidibacter thalassicus]|uniref:Cytidine deaminase n=1 Tax=Tepidibacter thalassicus DSM 15285 TaxID=1123350 RepID=A0A1M5NP65_9FIRM|nr:cytidine deaminase [Tepidibacter thalassicus]SHG91235.1 cytidine deaminase [Tepidibacter thalassicus DSM 15285]